MSLTRCRDPVRPLLPWRVLLRTLHVHSQAIVHLKHDRLPSVAAPPHERVHRSPSSPIGEVEMKSSAPEIESKNIDKLI